MEYSRICEAGTLIDTSALEKARQAIGKSVPFAQYRKAVLAHTPLTEGLVYDAPVSSAHVRWLPCRLCSLGAAATDKVIRFASLVNVNGKILSRSLQISAQAFAGNTSVTDILLPPFMQELPPAAFKGCSSLQRLTLPKSITHIRPDTFTGCDSLTDVYYEGSRKEWDSLRIFCRERRIIRDAPGQPVLMGDIALPGYEALLTAHIHYNCDFTYSEMPSGKPLWTSVLPASKTTASSPAMQKASNDKNETTVKKGEQMDTEKMQRLEEETLHRLMRGYDRHGYAILSASAGENTEEQKREGTEEMKRNLMALHYSYLPLYGRYSEAGGKELLEIALLVLPMNRTTSGNAPVELFEVFERDMVSLAKLYGQEAVVLKHPDLPPAVYACERNAYKSPFGAETGSYAAVQGYFGEKHSGAAAGGLQSYTLKGVYILKQPETLSGAHCRALQHEIIIYGMPK